MTEQPPSGSRWNKPTTWAILIALVFFAVNLAGIGQFGMGWDEVYSMRRGQQVLTFFSRTSPDEINLKADQASHPTFYASCNYLVAEFAENCLGWKPLPAGHLLNLIVSSAGLVILFHLGKRLFNERTGLVAVLFMVFFPRFVAHAHMNPKDVPVMVFGMLTLLMLCVAAERRRLQSWMLAGLSLAVSITTKLEALFLVPIFFLPWLLALRRKRELSAWFRRRELYAFAVASVLYVCLLWPALWTNPLQLMQSVSRFSGTFLVHKEIAYLGGVYAPEKLPWHYLPMHLAAVTPVVSLLAAGAGAFRSARCWFRGHETFAHGLLWSWLLIPLAARLLPGTLQYDGMRHVFLVVPVMALFAGLAVDRVWAWWQTVGKKAAVIPAAITCGVLGWLGWQVVQVHPDEAFYLNEAVRAAVPGPKLHQCFDFKGWGTIFKQGTDWLNANAPTGSSFAFGHEGYFPLERHEVRKDLQHVETAAAGTADFVIVGGWRGDIKDTLHMPVAFAVRRYDADLLWVLTNQTNRATK